MAAADRAAAARGWLSAELAGPATLAAALLCYTGALLVDGNGFVAAFVGGLAYGAVARERGEKEVYFVEQTSDLAAMMSWLVFGAPGPVRDGGLAQLGGGRLRRPQPHVIRMVPVALALVGSGLDRPSVLFVGWFGPRGLASVIFALLALEDLHGAGADVVAVIAVTVLLSVVAHGVTARPAGGTPGGARGSGRLSRPTRASEAPGAVGLTALVAAPAGAVPRTPVEAAARRKASSAAAVSPLASRSVPRSYQRLAAARSARSR